MAGNPRRIFFCGSWRNGAFFKDLSTGPNLDTSRAVELTHYMHPYQETQLDVTYFNGSLYFVKGGDPNGIGIMTDYDQTNRSYRVQEIGLFQDPWRILITSIEP